MAIFDDNKRRDRPQLSSALWGGDGIVPVVSIRWEVTYTMDPIANMHKALGIRRVVDVIPTR